MSKLSPLKADPILKQFHYPGKQIGGHKIFSLQKVRCVHLTDITLVSFLTKQESRRMT